MGFSGPIQAAVLLGRWIRIVERHGGGCSCCPGLGDVAIDEVEKRVTEWLRLDRPFTGVLRECIERRSALPADLQKNIDEALSELERIQSGMT